ncbi:hypothetical protein Anas_00824 [Armadillidium nasatum]|uniref:WIF domain-containing protein n=1 Tax=Armadillidium nasatum TaxID=96803 RepID=A0A5N5SYN5_9CRUS|nr:hypothetical protein Anas_00824 [Armadillidium nasatum]
MFVRVREEHWLMFNLEGSEFDKREALPLDISQRNNVYENKFIVEKNPQQYSQDLNHSYPNFILVPDSYFRFTRSTSTNSLDPENPGNRSDVSAETESPSTDSPKPKRRKERKRRGYNMEIYAIINGRVMSYILDPDFEDQLPIIPSEVESVNFTWRSPKKKYFYNFDLLSSFDQEILQTPLVSIRKRGRVPRKPKERKSLMCQ